MKRTVSIVISAYNEQENVSMLHRELSRAIASVRGVAFEIIFVNDGSGDGTLSEIINLSARDDRIRVVNLIKNYGHEIAMTAGMDYAAGDCVIFMDADLQHPPGIIPRMIDEWRGGADVVITKRVGNRDSSLFMRLRGALFYRLLNMVSDTPIPANTPDFRLIDRSYVEILKKMEERNRMFRGMINWIGLKNVRCIEFVAPERFAGISKYNLKRSLKLALDGLIQFSNKPLRLATYLGLAAAAAALLLGAYSVWEHIAYKKPPTGFATIIATMVFIGSVQLIVLGIIGEYIGRMYIEIKKRPLYIAEYLAGDRRGRRSRDGHSVSR